MGIVGRLGVLVVAGTALGLGGGCHTVEGAGKDLQNLGRGMQRVGQGDRGDPPPPPPPSGANPYEYGARE